MRLLLTGPKELIIQDNALPAPPSENELRLRVRYCAVCRTDARMWAAGHRDLVLPRVPGHEMVVADSRGALYAVWPGASCGSCPQCRRGRENRCEHLRIVGFHKDGGFADEVNLPKSSLIALPPGLNPAVACFAEPAGCIFHALGEGLIEKNARFLIYGGGTMGLLIGLVVGASGAEATIVEKNADKIKAARPFLDTARISCVSDPGETAFDTVINACPDAQAFGTGLTKLEKGGTFIFFSGLVSDAAMDINRINRIHYHEITLRGSYGLARADIQKAVAFLDAQQEKIKPLIQDVIKPEHAPGRMARVLSGNGFKYILDFST